MAAWSIERERESSITNSFNPPSEEDTYEDYTVMYIYIYVYSEYDSKFHAIMQSPGTIIILRTKSKQKYISIKYKIYSTFC